MSENKGREITLSEYLGRLRSQIVLIHSQSEEISLKAFDEVARKYADLLQKDKQIKDKEKELLERVKTKLPNNKISGGTEKEVPKKK